MSENCNNCSRECGLSFRSDEVALVEAQSLPPAPAQDAAERSQPEAPPTEKRAWFRAVIATLVKLA